ncbi:MAG: tRNA preQ1(34) S-adenosylmethionine ribosyltransferase-isomerase QueA [Lachnospiraceae bacterium]|nr:tRNA preQ1(34) S-adenosylmethionine ribosyltransferase-isomerase QueA [Lachnospiraceae bacterium]
MKLSDFNYYLPEELIAQDPLEDRSSSRLLVLNKKTGETEHRHFREIKEYLSEGDCLVINDTKVIPARLLGFKEDTGAHVEILLLKRRAGDIWECLVRPGKKLKNGARVQFGDGLLKAEITDVIEDGNRLVKFEYEGIFEEVLDKLGEMPLPPYITHKLQDKNRYQTVYAEHDGSAAAPTAGLHFTKELLSEIEAMGVKIARVTLHVGLGTFRPVKVDVIEEHHMHSEYYIVGQETADIVNSTLESGHRVFAVGTTSTRTLESAAVENQEYKAALNQIERAEKDGSSCIYKKEERRGLSFITDGSGRYIPKYRLEPNGSWTSIFIYPGYEWKLTECLITNFHLPESTLVMLVSALAGKENIMSAYEEAVKERYRFFSFGDAMLIYTE